MKPILKWQYEQIVKTLLLIQGHEGDPSCPCASEGETCMRKHFLELEALAQETIPICDDKKHIKELWTLVEETKALREDEERALCGKNRKQTTDVLSWSRDWRKKFEAISLACDLVSARVRETGLADSGPVAVLEIPAPFGWPGGKKNLAGRIIAIIPPHKTYVEPFAGAASVFWRKQPSQVEVLNDMDADLMRFYRHISDIKTCKISTVSEDWGNLKSKKGQLEPCEFLANVLCSFGNMRGSRVVNKGSEAGGGYHRCFADAPQFHQYLPEYQARLATTKLHNEDWEKVVRRYDGPDTFFFIAPPYHGTSRAYNHAGDQLSRLAEVLPTLKGKFLLTYDDHPDVVKALKRFEQVKVKSTYTLQAGANNRQGKQLMIANYPLKAALKDTDDDIVSLSDFWPTVVTGLGLGIGLRTIGYAWESAFKRGQFPARDKALRGLGPYTIIQEHDDGDLTVQVKGKLWVVTTEGKVFEEAKMKDATLAIRFVNETKRISTMTGDVVVRKYPILGTNHLTYDAWEHTKDGHSTITFFKGEGWKGRVGTKRLPKHLEALPAYSQDRLRKVKAWQEQEYSRAYRYIEEAFPSIKGVGTRRMGQIDLEVRAMKDGNSSGIMGQAGQKKPINFNPVASMASKYAIDLDTSPEEIVRTVANSDARARYRDKVSGAEISLNPDNMDQMLVFYGDDIAEAETNEEAVKILSYVRQWKKLPDWAYVFDTVLSANPPLAVNQVLDIPAETLSGESYRWGNPTGFKLFLPADAYCVERSLYAFRSGDLVLLSVCAPDTGFRSAKHLYAVKRSHLKTQIERGNIRIIGDMQDTGHEAGLGAETPAYIDVWKNTITKHYRLSSTMHKGSVRTVKSKGVLVILGCPKSAEWKGGVCSENQEVVQTHVTKTPEAMKEVREWEKAGVTINYKTKQEGITPRDSIDPAPGQDLIKELGHAIEKSEAIT